MMSAQEIIAFQRLVRQIPASEAVVRYAVNIASTSRPVNGNVPDFVKKYVTWGASLRASQFLVLAGKARAILNGRYNVSCEDIRAAAPPVLRHRILLNFQAESEKLDTDQITQRLIEYVPEPKSGLN
jgi:MoxR-like ATPase